ncbi:MAG: hypothetical protein AAGD25_34645 [Cyanobacteria bacterium P01_F01_bin.150]
MRTTVEYCQTSLSEEQLIYDHLLYWIERESPEQAIQRFRVLFLEGGGYPDAKVVKALGSIVASPFAPENFPNVLNRCCHILINRWQSRPQFQLAIPLLIELFESITELPSTSESSRLIRRSSLRYRLRTLVMAFRKTDQYATLRRLANVLSLSAQNYGTSKPKVVVDGEGTPVLGHLIRRYPYLYQHCLLSEHSTREQQFTVQRVQSKAQYQLELDLSRYVTSQVRRTRLQAKSSAGQLGSMVKPVINPTLLSDRALNRAIRHYSGPVISGRTYRDTACNFMMQSGQSQSYKSFKCDLYDYILLGIDSSYGQRQFNNQLHYCLRQILPHSDGKSVNDFLVVRTCSQLLNFLIVDNAKCLQHFVFVDLMTNLGPILTMGLLLRIVLLCRKVRPYLERRFSILFNHYENSEQRAVQWLVNALEVLNIALVTNFGKLDLSLVKS